MSIPDDPLRATGIVAFGRRLREGRTTAAAVTQAYLDRIAALDPSLSAYEYVNAESALSAAEALDRLLAAGTDLGPLMGVPVAVKDIIAVDGVPTTCGSILEAADLVGAEGDFVRRLRRAGCVLLGKVKTVEFATGNTGINLRCGTPRNPWDANAFRLPSGSSSGSAVAVAAGLCGFAVGTDTGGSVRGPAAFCGTFGIRPSPGVWPTDGMFPLSTTLDAVGLLTRSAADAATVFGVLAESAPVLPRPLEAITLGHPRSFFFDGLDDDVASCLDRAIGTLASLGVRFVDTDMPEAAESDDLYNCISRAETIATFGIDRFRDALPHMNPDVAVRITPGLEVTAESYIRALRRRDLLGRRVRELMLGLDGWVAPTKWRLAPVCPADPDGQDHHRLAALCAGPTRPASVFGLCASSQPIHQFGAPLPVGLQLMCPGGEDGRLLSVAIAIEAALGPAPEPDLSPFAI